ncbi:hypothetical protein [Ornithinicoccus hortensis]|uniref:hypothetical protein n=1 Tax=Ornithinicoccus hortensis TaxID=82346 RepID=UPI00115109A8|nr:hypothetical protein [Ornithinicoccus hortensis]
MGLLLGDRVGTDEQPVTSAAPGTLVVVPGDDGVDRLGQVTGEVGPRVGCHEGDLGVEREDLHRAACVLRPAQQDAHLAQRAARQCREVGPGEAVGAPDGVRLCRGGTEGLGRDQVGSRARTGSSAAMAASGTAITSTDGLLTTPSCL